jgi:hypothetical protein
VIGSKVKIGNKSWFQGGCGNLGVVDSPILFRDLGVTINRRAQWRSETINRGKVRGNIHCFEKPDLILRDLEKNVANGFERGRGKLTYVDWLYIKLCRLGRKCAASVTNRDRTSKAS